MFDENVIKIAKKYNKTSAQIVFRYLVSDRIVEIEINLNGFYFQIDIGTIPIPKSVNKNRIVENINVYDFALSADEIEFMGKFNTGTRVIGYPESKGHKYYPFSIEF